MNAEIICVGTELLLGDILNSNSQYLAQQLASLGIAHYYQTVVGDNPERLKKVLAIARERAQLLIFTGGLGPTPDDLTIETIADYFQTTMTERPEIVADIAEKFKIRGRVMTDNNRKQALIPLGADVLPNRTGTAPGIIWQPVENLTIMTFPGVPTEMKIMWQEVAVLYLQKQGWCEKTIVSRTLRFWGVTESSLAEKVKSFFDLQNPTVAPYANRGEVKLRISAFADNHTNAVNLITPVEEQLKALVGDDCFGADTDSLASVVGDLLKNAGQTLAIAESCTGGLLGEMLTAIPGSSDYFLGGAIAYSNQIKEKILGVNGDDLAKFGAVSEIVAQQMAAGVQAKFASDWGLSITGIAGPDGGTDDKPVGLVYLGIATPDQQVTSLECRFGGIKGRDWIRNLSACTALDLLRRKLIGV